MTTINPHIIDTIISAVSDFLVIDNVPTGHFVLVKFSMCPCHGATVGIVEHKALSELPKGLPSIQQGRTETSLPVVMVDEDGTVVHVRFIRWDEPRPFVANPGTMLPKIPKCNSRGGSA